jgi:hypothetical protein
MEPLDTFRSALPGWTLAVTELDDGVMGLCDLERQTIWVDVNLSAREMRATVMHEIIHAIRGDQHGLDPRAEHEVEIQTARRLIPPQALRSAASTATHPEDLADTLAVDIDVLRTRLRNLDPDETSLLRRRFAATLPADTATSEHCALGRWWLHHQQPGPLPCHARCPSRRRIGNTETANARRLLHAVPTADTADTPVAAGAPA